MKIRWGSIRILAIAMLMSLGTVLSACGSNAAVTGDAGVASDAAGAISCSAQETSCGTDCVDTNSDSKNCGACGVQCPDSFVCQSGACEIFCPQGQARCGNDCVDITSDSTNCGACGNACSEGELCSLSQCNVSCQGGTTQCIDQCVDVNNDPRNCGACEVTCATGQVCSAGTCGVTCLGGTTQCSNLCVDVDNDPSNCGTCGTACAAGEVCSAGTCSLTCLPGTTELCYSAALSTLGVGTCQSGIKTCTADGTGFGSCVGEVTPLLQEVCGNTSDENCDGLVNEGCLPHSCKAILAADPTAASGVYTIDVDGASGALAPLDVNCDMLRDGGGWTLMLKSYYQSGVHGLTGSFGAVGDGLTRKGAAYKLSDTVIRALIGSTDNFDFLGDQSGFNSTYSTGNFEYVVVRDYTGAWRFDGPVNASTTPTTMESFRASDDALAWRGELTCGVGGAGINCSGLSSGTPNTNPGGGSGCFLNMGTNTNAGWHHIYMGHTNADTYLYLCNGAQHSSNHNMNHRWWVRERN